MATLLHSIQGNKTSEGDKGAVNMKIDKASLFVDDTNSYIEKTLNSTRNFLQLINILDKVKGYKINTQNPVFFLSTNDQLRKKSGHSQQPQKQTNKPWD